MTKNLSDTLDLALERLQSGEPLSIILADYPVEAEQLSSLLAAAATLDFFPPVEMPATEALQADRTDFLAQVTNLQQAVSPGFFVRLKKGIVHPLPWLTLGLVHSEGRQRRMSTLLIKAMLVFGLLFGSAGGTAALAASSLPDSPLYPVKLALEDTRLAITSDPAQQAQLHLAMAQERTREMEQQALNGDIPGEATLNRLQQHLNYALQLAGQLPDEEMAGVLTQARQMTQTQLQQMTQTQSQIGEIAQERLGEANQLLNQVRQDAEGGLQDPLAFRSRFGHNRPEDAPVQPEPAPGAGQEPEPVEEPLPLDGSEPVPVQDPGVNPDCPTGNCEQNQYQYQHGQESDSLPGYGQDCETPGECEPVGDENKYGQDPAVEPGQHGTQCQSGEECDGPLGDENKYGQDTGQANGPQDDAGCGDNCDTAGNQNQNQNQNQQQSGAVEDPPPTSTDNGDDGQNGSLIGPGGSSGSNDDGGSSSGGSGNDGGGSGGSSNGGGKKN